MLKNDFPYPECKTCKDLGDCKHVELTDDGFSTPFTPDNCPKSNKIMAETEKRRRKYGRDITRDA